MQLRDYQAECLDKIWSEMCDGNSDQLVQLPTGAGKTIVFVHLLWLSLNKYPDLSACVLVNRVILVEQTLNQLKKVIDEESLGIYCSSLGRKDSSQVVVGSIESIRKTSKTYNLIIVDEAHRATSSKSFIGFIENAMAINPKCKVVRFTATPFTASGFIYGPKKAIKKLTYQMTLDKMIEDGHLAQYNFNGVLHSFDTSGLDIIGGDYNFGQLNEMACDIQKTLDQVYDALPRLVGRKKIVWSCVSIWHTVMLENALKKAGERSSIINSQQTRDVKEFNIRMFEEHDHRHLLSVTMVSEGYDYPPIDAIVLLRPTRSPSLYVQTVGRGLRNSPGKEDCLVLDYGNIVNSLGSPNAPKIKEKWQRVKDASDESIECPACTLINFLPIKKCKRCGYEFYTKEEVKEITKALTDEAYTHAVEPASNELDVWSVSINSRFTSSKGNHGVKVTYRVRVLTGPKVYHEYLMTEWNQVGYEERIKVKKIRVKKNVSGYWTVMAVAYD